MRFTSAIVAAVALASSALAQTAGFAVMTSPTQDQQIPAGSSMDLIWTPGAPTGAVSIVLLQGETAATLQLGATLATGVPSTLGKFTYVVPSTASFKTYGFKITLDSDSTIFQYSFPFHISGSSSSATSATGSVTSAKSSPSSSVAGVTTHVAGPTTIVNSTTVTSTVCTKCQHKPTSSAIAYSNNTSMAAPVSSPYKNSTTLASATKPASTAAGASVTSASSGTTASATPALVTANSAVAKAASAGLALGAMLMVIAL